MKVQEWLRRFHPCRQLFPCHYCYQTTKTTLKEACRAHPPPAYQGNPTGLCLDILQTCEHSSQERRASSRPINGGTGSSRATAAGEPDPSELPQRQPRSQGRLCKAMLGTWLSQLHWQPPPSMFSISTATALPSAAPRARVGLWFADRFLQQACAGAASISRGSRGTGRGQQQQHRAASKPSPLPQGPIPSPSPAELPSSQLHYG